MKQRQSAGVQTTDSVSRLDPDSENCLLEGFFQKGLTRCVENLIVPR